jgi:predicted HAD superfamily Cof-like phosphohydrolase
MPPNSPTIPSDSIIELRLRLMMEEYVEFATAVGRSIIIDGALFPVDKKLKNVTFVKNGDTLNPKEIADSMADMNYVVDGTASAFGCDMEVLHNIAHNSNMTKLWTQEEVDAIEPIEKSQYRIKKVKDCEKGYLVQNKFGKMLKSPSYTPANFSNIFPSVENVANDVVYTLNKQPLDYDISN